VTGDTQSPGQRLARQGLTLPDPPAAVAAFAPYARSGSTVYVSGQIAVRAGRLVTKGRVGADVDITGGQAAARMCALNVLVQLNAAGRIAERDRAAGEDHGVRRGHARFHRPAAGRLWCLAPVVGRARRSLLDVLGEAGAVPAPRSASPRSRWGPGRGRGHRRAGLLMEGSIW